MLSGDYAVNILNTLYKVNSDSYIEKFNSLEEGKFRSRYVMTSLEEGKFRSRYVMTSLEERGNLGANM